MQKNGVGGEIYFACRVAEMHAVLCCIIDFLFNRGIHCHQLILIITVDSMFLKKYVSGTTEKFAFPK